ncbi:MAG TPA: DNA repair and recombination protein RadB [Thermoplasmata archaeon]|nr:DNA repair and recombination protein RadB [Thermoplasmata archaeon]
MAADRVPTGVGPVDALLGGGLEPDSLTELYGEGGSAKTILCLQATLEVARAGRWVLYIDTEGVSVDRLEAIAGDRFPEVLDHLLLSSPTSLEEQSRAVLRAAELTRSGERPVGLIVLDSATLYYRLALAQDSEEDGRLALTAEFAELIGVSLRSQVPVLFTNQVWRDPRSGSLEPIGGSFLNHAAKTILRLERLPGSRRRAVLVKHRSRPEAAAEFSITDTGTGDGARQRS